MAVDENTRARAFSPRPASPNMSRRCFRRIERCCCTCATYFPLAFVYSITTWAVCVDLSLSATTAGVPWMGPTSGFVAVLLYFMLNWSYTTAVFTSPGCTTSANGYSTLPTRNPPQATSLTVKANGEMRFCKKCQARKPDRAHHCSTCQRCVLKMDHHCPWLATCLGLHNYKAFLLFLVYTTCFSIWSFILAVTWIVTELSAGGDDGQGNVVDSLWPINYIMLAVIAAVISLVLGGFTSWHLWLATKGQTTIECLEKTRYLTPLRRGIQKTYNNLQSNLQNATAGSLHMSKYGQQLVDMHANAIPGVTGPEEGEEFRRDSRSHSRTGSATDVTSSPIISPVPTGTSSNVERHANNDRSNSRERPSYSRPGSSSDSGQAGTKRWTYEEMERHRAQARYQEELDEREAEQLPHAFDLGVRRNLLHLFGPVLWLWAVPIMNTTGDGWNWEPSEEWLRARERLARQRAEQRERERQAGWGVSDDDGFDELKVPIDGVGRHYAGARSPRSDTDPGSMSPTSTTAKNGFGPSAGGTGAGGPRRPLSKADRVLGRDPNLYADGPGASVGLRRLNPAGMAVAGDSDEEIDLDNYEDSDDSSVE